MSKIKVSIVKTNRKPGFPEIRECVQKALNLIDGIHDIVKPRHVVLINPSWVAPPVEKRGTSMKL
jgi:uncharacterized protein (DUF362 family)